MRESSNDHHFKIRLSSDMKGHLEKAADRNRRSLTNEILLRLNASVQIERASKIDETGSRVPLESEEADLLLKMWSLLDDDKRDAILTMVQRLVL